MRIAQRSIAALFGLLTVSGCNPFDEDSRWHQRLVLEVETPEGLVSGGSVVAVRVWKGRAPGDAQGMLLSEITGESSFVAVAPGKYLFAPLGGDSTPGLPLDLFFTDPELDAFERAERLEGMVGETRVVPPDRYPLLVTFGDINHPASVRRVEPSDLTASFGPGIKLKRITLLITDEPVTSGGMDKVLGWLEALDGKYLHGGFTSRGAPFGLHGGNFKKGT